MTKYFTYLSILFIATILNGCNSDIALPLEAEGISQIEFEEKVSQPRAIENPRPELSEEEKKQIIADIKEKYSEINSSLDSLLKIERELIDDKRGSVDYIEAFVDNKMPAMIRIKGGGEMSAGTSEYFFWDGELFFAYIETHSFNTPRWVTEEYAKERGAWPSETYNSEKTITTTDRYYVYKGNVIKLLNDGVEVEEDDEFYDDEWLLSQAKKFMEIVTKSPLATQEDWLEHTSKKYGIKISYSSDYHLKEIFYEDMEKGRGAPNHILVFEDSSLYRDDGLLLVRSCSFTGPNAEYLSDIHLNIFETNANLVDFVKSRGDLPFDKIKVNNIDAIHLSTTGMCSSSFIYFRNKSRIYSMQFSDHDIQKVKQILSTVRFLD